jgi:hypothetical protein
LPRRSNSPAHYAKGTRSGLRLATHSPPTACRQTVSGSISLPSPGFFSPFPHGTGSLSVAREYLALEGGPSGFPRGFTCPVVLGNAGQRDQSDFAYRAFTFCGGSFQSLQLSPDLITLRGSPTSAPQPRTGFRQSGLGYSRFARRYSGNRVFFLFLEVLRCFSSLGSRHATYGFSDGRLGITPAGFPHSGILGSKPACGSPRLIAASHALHRFLAPRHPPFALSSLTTNFYCLLAENIAWLHSRINVFGCQRASAAKGRDTGSSLVGTGGDDRSRTGDPLLAKQVLSQLSYIPQHCHSGGPSWGRTRDLALIKRAL